MDDGSQKRESSPLSFAQQRLWFLHQLAPQSPSYNIPIVVELTGELDVAALQRSLDRLVERHEVLRTTFGETDGVAVQEIHPPSACPLCLRRVTTQVEEEAFSEARDLADAEVRTPFDLSRDLPFRALLVQLSAHRHLLVLTLHHIVGDGWSRGTLLRDLGAFYRAEVAGSEMSGLPDLPLQYRQYAQWQREWLQGEVLDRQRRYWKRQLADLGVVELPTDKSRPVSRRFEGDWLTMRLPDGLSSELDRLCRDEGVTMYMALLAAFVVLLHRYTGQHDLVVGSPVANRSRTEVHDLVGMFVNTVVMRTDVSGDPSLRELLLRVRQVALDVFDAQDMPFEKLVQELHPDRDPARNPLFQIVFALQNTPMPETDFGDLEAVLSQIEAPGSRFDLELHVLPDDGGLSLLGVYDTEIFHQETIGRLLEHYQHLLGDMVRDPGRSISELEIEDPSVRQRVLQTFSGEQVDYCRQASLAQLFEEVAAGEPEAVAIETGSGETMSYGQLNCRSNQLARYLGSRGVGRGDRVGICCRRSPEMVVGLLAILKAGAAYVPLDPGYPRSRLQFMLQDSQARLVLVDEGVAEAAAGWAPKTIVLEQKRERISQESGEDLDETGGGRDLAYVMYTSGSTGRPKGVAVPQRAVTRLVREANYVELGPSEVFLQLAPISFDASTFELWASLLNGSRLVLYPDRRPTLQELGRFIRQRGITTLWLTAALFHQMVDEQLESLRGVKQLLAGGDVLSVPHVEKVLAALGPGQRLINGYGPTENTTFTCCHVMDGDSQVDRTVPIGRPITNTQVYILDGKRRPAPIGVAGELYIGGDGLALGYWNRPELTERRFLDNPYGDGRLYRSGDRCRWRSDGAIEFFGRLDDQVKIRGYRVEPGEVESVLADHPAVEQAAVTTCADGESSVELAAYLIGRSDDLSVGVIREHVETVLPEYMRPASYTILPEFPLTPSGKLDRRSLPEPSRRPAGESSTGARTPVEDILLSVWKDVLETDLGVDDNFFECGGHSLKATSVVARASAALGVELPLSVIFESPTVATMAAAIDKGRRPPLKPVPPADHQHRARLSFGQQRLWFLQQLDPGVSAYNIAVAYRLEGVLDRAALEASFKAVIDRHEALRTTIEVVDGHPRQKIHDRDRFELEFNDLRSLPSGQRREVVKKDLEAEVSRPFALDSDLMIRAGLHRLGDREHVLVMTLHHIACDGWSMEILLAELATAYRSFRKGIALDWPSLPLQYADHAAWQRRRVEGPELEAQLSYWRQQLDQAPPLLELPTDFPRPQAQTYRGDRKDFRVPDAVADRLRELALQESATPFMVSMAVFSLLLSRFSGRDDIVVGTPVSGRSREETEALIGFFVNTLVLRTRFRPGWSFRDLVRRTREVCLEAQSHSEVPFERLVEELDPARSLAQSPLFQVMFAYHDFGLAKWDLEGLHATPEPLSSRTSKFDLSLNLVEGGDGLIGELEYSSDLFEPNTAERLIGGFQSLMAEALDDPDRAVGDFEILGDESESAQIRRFSTGPEADFPRGGLHQLFARQVEKTPDARAVEFKGQVLTYRQLDERANRLAHFLRDRGIRPRQRVGLCLRPSLDTVTSILAVLKAGAVWLPLDPGYPDRHLGFMIADGRPGLVLAQERFLERLGRRSAGARTVSLEEVQQQLDSLPAVDPDAGFEPDRAAYLIYTSGSTGRPKGVVGLHRGMVNRFAWMWRQFPFEPGDVCCHRTSLSFVDSIWEVLGSLLQGVPLVVIPGEAATDLRLLVEQLAAAGVTRLTVVPSMLASMLDGFGDLDSRLPALRFCVSSGESLSRELVDRFHAALPGRRLVNLYGSSEVSADVTFHETSPAGKGSVSIGTPIDNTTIRIVDRSDRAVPVGVVGQICVGGANLAAGYWNRPELTERAFSGLPGEEGLFYRTGDLGRWRSDGSIELVGRSDHQVQVRGFRIEPGEIEAALRAHPQVKESVVVSTGEGAGCRLAAYFVSSEPDPPAESSLRQFLQEGLPWHMIPSHFIALQTLPRTPNGKIDRLRLPGVAEAPVQESVEPETVTERTLLRIWERVLDVDGLGVTDDYFRAGGTSLRAVELFARVESELGIRLPISTLFRAPTIRRMGAAVDKARSTEGVAAGRGRTFSPLVEIRGVGSRPPLFLFHSHGGNVLEYRALAERLSDDQPVYALQSSGLSGRFPDAVTIEAMVADYLEEVRAVHPGGPYLLAGFCFGGLLALEAAQQLRRENREVAFLGLLETIHPGLYLARSRSLMQLTAGAVATRLSLEAGNLAVRSWRGRGAYLIDRAGRITQVGMARARIGAEPWLKRLGVKLGCGSQTYVLEKLGRIHTEAFLKYQIRFYPQELNLFLASRQPIGLDVPADFGWSKAVGNLNIVHVAGHRQNILEAPRVEETARQLDECLVRVLNQHRSFVAALGGQRLKVEG